MRRFADIPGSEAYAKRHALEYARAVGCVVVDTATHRRNARAGIPDAFITHPRHGNRWAAVDFKSPTGKPTAEQRALVDAGLLDIVSDVAGMVLFVRQRFPGVTK